MGLMLKGNGWLTYLEEIEKDFESAERVVWNSAGAQNHHVQTSPQLRNISFVKIIENLIIMETKILTHQGPGRGVNYRIGP